LAKNVWGIATKTNIEVCCRVLDRSIAYTILLLDLENKREEATWQRVQVAGAHT
jgi:hypothetical protein